MINPFRTTEADILREFIADVEAAGVAHVAEEWPDLLVTYRRAVEILGQPPASGRRNSTLAAIRDWRFSREEFILILPSGFPAANISGHRSQVRSHGD